VSESVSQRDRAKQFADQIKSKLNSEFGDRIDWEGDSPPSLKFVIKNGDKKYEMRLEYLNGDDFELYDRDAKTQRNETLGKYSSENITTPNDPTPDQVVAKVKEYTS